LVDPNLARAIVADAGVGPGDRVVEVGAGLGSLTVALADAGCDVLALEFDRALIAALEEVTEPLRDRVRVMTTDAMRTDWDSLLVGDGWAMVSNLPYNISVPLLLDLLQGVPAIDRYLVMIQREVGERLVAMPGQEAYGALSVRVAYRGQARLVRRVRADVFWPRPKVGSVLVRVVPHPPPVDVDQVALFAVVERGFAERRKTMSNALRRLGLDAASALAALDASGLDPQVRAERLGLAEFAAITRTLLAGGWRL
jgi:16S rRNA (adenine1518-N6/adenine1519-N6)-dimethyltransferase